MASAIEDKVGAGEFEAVTDAKLQLLSGNVDTDEYFCLILSLWGHYKTKLKFPLEIETFKHDASLQQELCNVYEQYFDISSSKIGNETVTSSIESGYLSSDYGYELDYELAVKLSLEINGVEKEKSKGSLVDSIANHAGDNPRAKSQTCQHSKYEKFNSHVDCSDTSNNCCQNSNEKSEKKEKHISVNSKNKVPRSSAQLAQSNAVMNYRQLGIQQKYVFTPSECKNLDVKDDKKDLAKNFGRKNSESTPQKETPLTYTEEKLGSKSIIPGLVLDDCPSERKRRKKKNRNQQLHIESMTMNKPIVYWLRRDLRTIDNPALVEALQSDAPVIMVFIWAEKEEGPKDFVAAGGATKLWLHHALAALDENLKSQYGNRIIFRKSQNSLGELKKIISESGADKLVFNKLHEPVFKSRDENICHEFTKAGIRCQTFSSYCLHDPDEVNTESLGMRGIGSVTHFMECCRQSKTKGIGHPLDAPNRTIPSSRSLLESEPLSSLDLAWMPRRKDGSIINWAAPIVESWDFSEQGAWNALDLFLTEGVKKYEKESCRADSLNTCRISPYLHFGQISPRSVLEEAKHMKSPKFLRKLAWRDLSYWLLTLWPNLPVEPTRPHYRHQRWSEDGRHLKAWQRGNTGFPLVDAAMRQLWLTGWMNNYMRHVVASFLISYLHISWVEGYKWFQDTLLDADVAINAMMWQNGGMSGLDQWNFVMHPVDAALTCDPEGSFVRRWCPELASLPTEFIHQPWKCPLSILKRSNVQLGGDYPHRIITDLEDAREQSLRDVVNIRRKYSKFVDPRTGNDLVPMPRGFLLPVITRMEFKFKTSHPETRENPHSAVLRGYRSRKRDEAIAFANQRDFLASTMNEIVTRGERASKAEKFNQMF